VGIVVERPRLVGIVRNLQLLRVELELAFMPEFDLKDFDQLLVRDDKNA